MKKKTLRCLPKLHFPVGNLNAASTCYNYATVTAFNIQ